MGPFQKSWREAWHRLTWAGMDLGHGTWDNQAGPDSKDLGGTGRSIHHHHLEADMAHVCAGIHFYSGTCERWRIWNKPRYRQFSVAAP